MKYSDFLKIDETFQYSINLQFDINNINKIKEYIPTKDSCEVMEKYIDSILGKFNKSTTLIGPYGKGKSHLMLVLLTLLNNYNECDKEEIEKLLAKIENVNNELYKKLKEIRDNKLKYMPIIINSNYNNMNQAFLLGLNEALEREKITDLVINTYYEVALDIINKWELDNEVKNKLDNCLDENKTSLKVLKNSLKIYDEKYYQIFKNIYLKIMHGMEFNPLINTDLIKLYKDVTYKIQDKGYNGVIVVFDEFSKFLEYVGNESMMKDLKLLQDFAELSSRTGKKEQIIFTCITHKTINEYIKNLKEDKVNAFKTVEGRFKEIYFNRSMEQNYEIISQTIKRGRNFNKNYQEFFNNNINFYEKVQESFNFLQFENCNKALFEGCYPLNPITVYSVINLSEKIAQNERTLFTFLTDDDVYSFKSYINNYDGNELFNVDRIYDYFCNLFKKDSDENIRKNWLKADSALSKVDNELDKKIIKSLAIIYMINDFNVLNPNEITLRLSINLDEHDFQLRINELVEKGIIKYKKTNKTYDFSSVYNKEVLNDIRELVNIKFYNINEKDALNKIIDFGYVIPRRYNQEYKMTRFFKNIFVLDKELVELKNLNVIKKNTFSDGLVLNLILTEGNISELVDKFKTFQDDEAVLKISKIPLSDEITESLKELEAIEYMLKNISYEDEVILEINLIKNELLEYINIEIQKMYESQNIIKYIYKDQEFVTEKISYIVSNVCEKIYFETPIINNEMINKEVISSPIYKARNIVLDSILNEDKELIKSGTSAEATIFKATVSKQDNEDIKNVIKIIKDFIKKSEENDKKSLNKLIEKLKSKPYGIRTGIIPILLCIAIDEYKDRIVLYYKNKEIDLNSINISKISEEPENYYISIEKGSEDKDRYVEGLLEIFNLKAEKKYREKVKLIIEEMKRWVLSFPRIIRELNENNALNISKEIIEYKNELLKPDINNNEFLFIRIKEIFNTQTLLDNLEKIKNAKEILDNFLNEYKKFVVENLKEIFEHNSKASLNLVLKKWYETLDSRINRVIMKLEIKNLLEYIKDLVSYNELEIVENISNIVVGKYIEDWQTNTFDEFISVMKSILIDVQNFDIPEEKNSETITISSGNKDIIKYIDSSNISLIGNTLKNNLEDILEEYGDSIDELEKIKVILEILKKYI